MMDVRPPLSYHPVCELETEIQFLYHDIEINIIELIEFELILLHPGKLGRRLHDGLSS